MLASTLGFALVALAGGLVVLLYGRHVRPGLPGYRSANRAPILRRIDENAAGRTEPHLPTTGDPALTRCDNCGAANRDAFSLCRVCLHPIESTTALR